MPPIHDLQCAEVLEEMADRSVEAVAYARVLADAIERTGLDDERLSKRTWDQVSPQLVGDLRHCRVPVPPWYCIGNLLGVCKVNAAQIGQGVSEDRFL